MKFKVDIGDITENVEVKEGSKVIDLLNAMKISPVTAIVTVNDDIVVEDYELKDSDKIRVILIASQG